MIVLYEPESYNDIKLAEHLAPPHVLERFYLPKYTAILAVDDQNAVTCGAMLVSISRRERLDILWLYVMRDRRCEGIGEQLLSKAFEMATKRKIRHVGVMPLDCPEDPAVRERIGDYLYGYGFSTEQQVYGDRVVKISEYDQTDAGKTHVSQEHILSVNDVHEVELKGYLKRYADRLAGSPLYEYDFALKHCNRDLSVVYQKDKEIGGVFLVSSVESRMYAIALTSSRPMESLALIEGVRTAAEKNGSVLSIMVPYSMRNERLLQNLFSDKGKAVYPLWDASTDTWNKRA